MNTAPGPAGGNGLLLFLVASAVMIALTYGASRLLGQWQVNQARGLRMRVLEGVPAGKDRSLLLVAVGKEVLVIGSSPAGFALLHQVSDPEALAEMLPAQAQSEPVPAQGLQALETSVRASLERMQALMARKGGGTGA